jgi:predicted nucleotide-binding protein
MPRGTNDALFNALTEFTSKSWDGEEWSQFGRDTGTSDILAAHPRLYRSLRFGDPDYPDAVRDIFPDLFRELGPTDQERLQVIAEVIPHFVAWARKEASYRTKKQFFQFLDELEIDDVPGEWVADYAAHDPEDQFRSPSPAPARSAAGSSSPVRGASQPSAASSAAPADSATSSGPAAPIQELRKDTVFVVRGRDPRPYMAIETFLGFLGLRVLTWGDAVRLTGQPQPRTYDIVKAGIQAAAAIVVIFSPDDLAQVKDEFSEDETDKLLQGKARQNVTFEAGMAFMSAPERTIFVRSSSARMPSDLDGFNWVKLDGSWNARDDFRGRLEAANAAVRPRYDDLNHHAAGPFEAV